jgi:hypothetical protein
MGVPQVQAPSASRYSPAASDIPSKFSSSILASSTSAASWTSLVMRHSPTKVERAGAVSLEQLPGSPKESAALACTLEGASSWKGGIQLARRRTDG